MLKKLRIDILLPRFKRNYSEAKAQVLMIKKEENTFEDKNGKDFVLLSTNALLSSFYFAVELEKIKCIWLPI